MPVSGVPVYRVEAGSTPPRYPAMSSTRPDPATDFCWPQAAGPLLEEIRAGKRPVRWTGDVREFPDAGLQIENAGHDS